MGEAAGEFEVPGGIARRGRELKLVFGTDDHREVRPDPVLLRLVALARLAQQNKLQKGTLTRSLRITANVTSGSCCELAGSLLISWLRLPKVSSPRA